MQFIRTYNNFFSSISIGFIRDEGLTTGKNDIYEFLAQGMIYHSIGSILPHENNRLRYMKMWIVDIDNEIDKILLENQKMRRGLLVMLQKILDQDNPFVKVFRKMERLDIPICILLVVIIDNEYPENLNGRDSQMC